MLKNHKKFTFDRSHYSIKPPFYQVGSDNGTYQDDTDREAIQYEVDALKSEIDRISSATEYNGMKLLDGSLSGAGGAVTEYGPKYGLVIADAGKDFNGATITSNLAGVGVKTTYAASKNGESATWDQAGKVLTFNLVEGKAYTQDDINQLIKNADTLKADGDKPELTVTLKNGVMTAGGAAAVADGTKVTVAGVRASVADTALAGTAKKSPLSAAISGYGDQITFTSNSYGVDTRKFSIATDAEAGKESVETMKADTTGAKDGAFTIHLSTGKEYTEKDIEALLAKEGLDYSIDITDSNAPDGDVSMKFDTKVTTGLKNDGTAASGADGVSNVLITMAGGAGVGKEFAPTTGEGLTFQIGANGVEDQRVTLTVDDMSSAAIGVDKMDVSTRDAANKGIEMVDKAVKTVSMQRAGLGAMQNRLEYTVNNLTVTNENLTNAESQIRDTDMATEMINYTKFNILQQASQAMLAQANQQPQAVLQLLG